MIIPINDKWAITTDPNNVCISRKGKKNKAHPLGWFSQTFHRDIESAFQDFLQMRIREIPDDCPVEKIKEEIGAIRDEIRATWAKFNNMDLD